MILFMSIRQKASSGPRDEFRKNPGIYLNTQWDPVSGYGITNINYYCRPLGEMGICSAIKRKVGLIIDLINFLCQII
jgi:hypothetical protein